MIWTIEWDDAARKELRKLDKQLQKDSLRYFRERIATYEDPRRFGKPLAYDKYGLWRYGVRNARMLCQLFEDELLVLVVRVGYRKDVYR